MPPRAHQEAGADGRLLPEEVLDREAGRHAGRSPLVTGGDVGRVRLVPQVEGLVGLREPPGRVGEPLDVPSREVGRVRRAEPRVRVRSRRRLERRAGPLDVRVAHPVPPTGVDVQG